MLESIGLVICSALIALMAAMVLKLASGGGVRSLRFSMQEYVMILVATAVIIAVFYYAMPDIQ
jgi:hypothetical protein